MERRREEERGGGELRCPSIHRSIHPAFLLVRVSDRGREESASNDVTGRWEAQRWVAHFFGFRDTTLGRAVIGCRHIQRRLTNHVVAFRRDGTATTLCYTVIGYLGTQEGCRDSQYDCHLGYHASQEDSH